MEDGAKEEPARSKEPGFLGKSGWVKKATGRLLASYKDRFIHVEKTEMVVYEKEDRQNCLERLDLENYDECHEIKSAFKKKHRLILIRSAKSGNKVHDVKLQTQSAEEKEAWIKALLDGINRAKNKVFDEVTVDETSNLEHVTRSRPKGNRGRRPPTRIHMKEIAVVSSDGLLRLDLDLEDAVMPNGTHHASVDGTETPKVPPSNTSEAAEKQTRTSEEEEAEPESASPRKTIIKPPMPPIKEKSSSPPEDEPDKKDSTEKKVLKPPMPPSKEAKPSAPPTEEATDEAIAEKKKAAPPPTPPNKPSSSTSSPAEASEAPHPPTPPSKDMKPSHPPVEPDHEAQGTTAESEEKEEDEEEDQSTHEEALPGDDQSEIPSAEGRLSDEESEETMSSGINEASDSEPQIPTKSLSLPLDIKKTPEKLQHMDDSTTQDPAVLLPDTSSSRPEAEEAPPRSEASSALVSVTVPDSPSLSPLLCHLPGEKKKKEEEKSVDSGQHSDDDSEASGSEDTLAVSTAALRGSHAGLDALDAGEDDVQTPVSLRPMQLPPKPQVRPRAFPYRRSEPTPLLKPPTKARSASIGNLLSDSDSSVCIQVRQQVAGGDADLNDDVTKLKTEVALEMEKTKEILSRVSQSQEGGDGEGMPEELLIKAMEKLKKAEHVLKEANKLSSSSRRSTSCRKSW